MNARWASALLCITLCGCPGGSEDPESNTLGPQTSSDEPQQELAPEPVDEPAGPRPTTFGDATPRQEELRGMAILALESGDIDTAVTALISMSDTEPMSELKASSMLLLSELYIEEGQVSRAMEVLLGLRQDAPEFAELEFIIGRTFMEQGALPDAEEAFRNAIRLNPDFLRSYVSLGSMLASQDNADEAAEIFLAYERVVYRMADVLESDAPVDEKLLVIDQLSLSLPDDRLSRALERALDDDSLAVRAAAVTALGYVGTLDAVPALEAMLRDRADSGACRAHRPIAGHDSGAGAGSRSERGVIG